MAITESSTGSTATDGTEQTLATINTAGDYQFVINTDALVNGDCIEIRIKRKARVADGAAGGINVYPMKDDQGEACVFESPWYGIPTNGNLVITMKRVLGTDRTHTWAVLTR